MELQLQNIIISPDNGEKLIFRPQENRWITDSGDYSYEQISGVPVLLSSKAREKVIQSEHHIRLGSTFHYIDHYQVDAEAFDYFEEVEDGAARDESRRLHETIISEVPSDARNILDVGCGKAWVAGHFCEKGMDVFSMDISTVNPVKAVEKYPYDNHYGLVADVYSLPIREEVFDCIIASEIIEHVPDPAGFIGSLVRVLKPGGRLIITTPYAEKITYSLCIHCNRPTPVHAHLHSFKEKKLIELTPQSVPVENTVVYTFGNKALIRLKTFVVLRHFPFSFWNWIDRLANRIINKPSRILYRIEKLS